ncbi:protein MICRORCHIDIA 6-like [Glycine soja]|uniref:Protein MICRORCHIDIA 6 isoform C n=2 Tax=Glycine soja TaxID=3848 RepID=A0A445L268_GLYSO|nr:protein MICRORCHIDIA 6-like [Glycine soja]XP_028229280.1 protein MICRORCHIDIA 6-like [Glycine soja]KHN30927.1 MORC family CW-type zinc finger protein 3 [Glycine soja]RZC17175.1 Protein MICRORCHIDIA 6 isoform C [Glycine soja]RZC17176.1 Protein MICRORCHIDIA 6 isoform D [Glycine soja]
MGPTEVVYLSSDDESEKEVAFKAVKLEEDFVLDAKQYNETNKGQLAKHKRSQSHTTGQDSEENLSSNGPSTGHSNSSVLEQGPSPVDDTGISYASSIGVAPLCRQFWKAGNYDDGLGSKVTVQNAKNYLHVHPMFLHSNATSHKWAFGAIAELLDNAVDEIQNGATFVIVDKTSNPRDGSPALLIQDDGGGMDPDAMRRCMSFGFSDKKSQFAIGRYGNGFKTSSMRLGADVIVFSCHLNNRILTQSIGLLSYTYLIKTQLDRIVVPMVNYEFDTSTGSLKILNGNEHFVSNLSLLLRWSPYSSEADLLKQFDDIGSHGTKVIIYNLWCNDDANLELDFDTDPTDIRIAGDVKQIDTLKAWKSVNEEHIANRLRYSLHVYMSILYLKIPESFQMILRGQVVKPHNIADDLKFPQFVKYAPVIGGSVKGTALTVTTIGFLKEAPQVNIHGFNVYHKNRLILPFWQVVSYLDSRGRGVVGILQADFIEPTHNKQDFERTSLFQKLEGRLKEMTWEYWDTHCTLFGYKDKDKKKLPPRVTSMQKPLAIEKPVMLNRSCSPVVNTKIEYGNSEQCSTKLQIRSEQGSHNKRKTHELVDLQNTEKHARTENVTCVGFSQNKQIIATPADQVFDRKTMHLVQQNKKLHAKCLEFEKTGEELNLKVTMLKSEIQEAQDEYKRLLAEVKSLDLKEE